MAFTAIEGRVRLAEEKHNGLAITGFKVVLFTNAAGTLTVNSTAADLTQPTGGGYSPVSIAKSGWTVNPLTAEVSRASVDFIPSGSNYSAPVTGCATLVVYNGTDYLDGVMYFASPRTLVVGGKETITFPMLLG